MSDEKQDQDENIGNADPLVDVELEDKMLLVPMTEQERLEAGEAMAQAQEEAEASELKKKAMDEEFKGIIDKYYERVSANAKSLRYGKITRAVQCRIVKDYRLGWVRVHRLDDQTEVSSRPMTTEERQTGLNFGGSV